GVAGAHDTQAGVDHVGERQRGEEVAPGRDHDADGAALRRVEQVALDEHPVHERVEVRVVGGVVDVTVDVVVRPAGDDLEEVREVAARSPRFLDHGGPYLPGGGPSVYISSSRIQRASPADTPGGRSASGPPVASTGSH